ncbi:DDE superfamily endonuclease [Hirsutella rhossiliensis]|uniref:DDE superfamily endonuclease domain-containing protein n=1 Tax=Hirsutella rhossiliensis TaxID=111463 RepID=A0A9P8SH31_9HYPO|nr:DDE superfamily endonuclease domain-containing protein [Hirsutella rhossiliensis]XP_044719242.1 DDE superfamily endonuclease domain-containing protein [Hirsutella rhossiliensis]KAH0961269.1 DDE superfamily endonuclease domain-containing protein [Hirsutella rhossiliensis]KAH0961729.1 DDE superfamily endonuclease domain-containing protein [Hirsutella rhossiliensis]
MLTKAVLCLALVWIVLCYHRERPCPYPGIIFKGKELQKQWFLTEFGKIADWHYITSPNGWTDNHVAIEWLERVYLPQTRPADASDARLIILDGHGSHATDAWMATCF